MSEQNNKKSAQCIEVLKRRKQVLPPNIRNLVYSFLEFHEKFRMIYLCKAEYKFLGEWKLYES